MHVIFGRMSNVSARELSPNSLRTTVYRTVTAAGLTTRWGYGRTAKVDRRSSYSERTMSELVIVYVLRGSGRFTDGRGVLSFVGAGDALVHWAGQPCSLTVDANGRWIEQWITADRAFSDAMFRLGVIDPDRTVLHIGVHDDIAERIDRFGKNLRNMNDEDVDRLTVELHELLVEVNRRTRFRQGDDSEVALVQQACRRLAEQFDEPLSIPSLSRQLGVPYERFRKLFRRHVGVAPGEYRVRRRIDRARELIVQKRLDNGEVAAQLGYADPFVFSKQFKRLTGEAPDTFRRRMA
ncbi:MAG TPA: AraC family transcriptional regulator [Spirochaetia bacterium]|nr:AraC family transcriptional regulator [Spirochaetia bacterium]